MSNTTPINAKEYDLRIEETIPFYSEFSNQTIDLIRTFGFINAKWLDTGCGTGSLILKALSLKDFEEFQFILYDPSEEMMEVTKKNLDGNLLVELYASRNICN